MKVAIIGGGPAGLVTLKHLLEAKRTFGDGIGQVQLFESQALIGGTFRYRTYEDGELVSSRHLTAFSDFRLPESSPDFLSTDAYCEYLEKYATHFNLWPHIRLNTTVRNVRRGAQGGHVVTLSSKDSDVEEQWQCDAVAVCSGLNVTPNVPTVHGIENAPTAFHSSVFKRRKQFGEGKNVMILGAGETAMDLAYLAVTAPTNSVTLCHRGGWKNQPKFLADPIMNGDVAGREAELERNGPSPPVDTAFASLFDTAYVHPALDVSNWQWEYYYKFTSFYAWLLTGTSEGIDQYAGEIRGKRHHARYSVANKSNRAMAYISDPYRPKVPSIVERLRAHLYTVPRPDTKGRVIDLAPWPDHFDADGRVHFQDNGRPEYETMKHVVCKPDIVVFATGYTQVFPFLDEGYPCIFDADIRRIWKTGVDDVAFIGFCRPSLGAIPPLAELQAQLWILNLVKRLPKPIEPDESYLSLKDPCRRVDYLVDHEAYAYKMACDMGTAPSMTQVMSHGPTVFLSWALGPNFNTKFRLVGPWQWSGAASVMAGEQWTVVKRRKGFIIWGMMSFIPITVFGAMSLSYAVVYGIRDLFAPALRAVGLNVASTPSTSPIRNRDPTGKIRAQAIRDSHGSQKVIR